MQRPNPEPTCRRPDCGEPRVAPYGYCLAHDLQYARWRAWRDELERDDLAHAHLSAGREKGGITEAALDVLWRHLTPGPFSTRDD